MDGAVGPLGELAGQVPVQGLLDLPLDDVPEDLTQAGHCRCAGGAEGHGTPQAAQLDLCLVNTWVWIRAGSQLHLGVPGVEPGSGQGQQQLRLCRTQLSGLEVSSFMETLYGGALLHGHLWHCPCQQHHPGLGCKMLQPQTPLDTKGANYTIPVPQQPQGSPLLVPTSTLPVLAASCRGFNPS